MGKEIQYTHGNEIDRQAFSGDRSKVVSRAIDHNRTDVLRRIANERDDKLEQAISSLSSKNALNDILRSGTIRNAKNDQERIGTLKKDDPKPPKDALRIHKPSLELYLNTKSGHTLTGLVHIHENGEYKVSLAPLVPSRGSRYSSNTLYPIRPPDTNTRYHIYQHRDIAEPIEHLKKDSNGDQQTAHRQLVDLIKEKYPDDEPDSGKYIAFTLTKGRIIDGFSNRYNVTSGSIHWYTFDNPSRDAPHEWEQAIRRTFDRLSIIEYAMHKEEKLPSELSLKDAPSKQTATNDFKIRPSYLRVIQDMIRQKD